MRNENNCIEKGSDPAPVFPALDPVYGHFAYSVTGCDFFYGELSPGIADDFFDLPDLGGRQFHSDAAVSLYFAVSNPARAFLLVQDHFFCGHPAKVPAVIIQFPVIQMDDKAVLPGWFF